MDEYPNLVVLDADLAAATKSGMFKKAHPERFFDCGIAEGNMMGVAAGLAAAGMLPFASSFAMFATGRAYEQVRLSLIHIFIKGIAHTAPFSPWSFGYYSAQVLPLLSVALLFFLWGIFSKEARRVKPLTDATPVNAGNYLMGKCAAVGAAWLLLAVCVCALGMGFLATLFGACLLYTSRCV